MHKDELIHMHTLMCQIKNAIETTAGPQAESPFSQYKTMGISPIHVHRSKAEHKRAIYVLGKEISAYLANGEFSAPARTAARMQEMLGKLDRQTHDRLKPTPASSSYGHAGNGYGDVTHSKEYQALARELAEERAAREASARKTQELEDQNRKLSKDIFRSRSVVDIINKENQRLANGTNREGSDSQRLHELERELQSARPVLQAVELNKSVPVEKIREAINSAGKKGIQRDDLAKLLYLDAGLTTDPKLAVTALELHLGGLLDYTIAPKPKPQETIAGKIIEISEKNPWISFDDLAKMLYSDVDLETAKKRATVELSKARNLKGIVRVSTTFTVKQELEDYFAQNKGASFDEAVEAVYVRRERATTIKEARRSANAHIFQLMQAGKIPDIEIPKLQKRKYGIDYEIEQVFEKSPQISIDDLTKELFEGEDFNSAKEKLTPRLRRLVKAGKIPNLGIPDRRKMKESIDDEIARYKNDNPDATFEEIVEAVYIQKQRTDDLDAAKKRAIPRIKRLLDGNRIQNVELPSGKRNTRGLGYMIKELVDANPGISKRELAQTLLVDTGIEPDINKAIDRIRSRIYDMKSKDVEIDVKPERLRDADSKLKEFFQENKGATLEDAARILFVESGIDKDLGGAMRKLKPFAKVLIKEGVITEDVLPKASAKPRQSIARDIDAYLDVVRQNFQAGTLKSPVEFEDFAREVFLDGEWASSMEDALRKADVYAARMFPVIPGTRKPNAAVAIRRRERENLLESKKFERDKKIASLLSQLGINGSGLDLGLDMSEQLGVPTYAANNPNLDAGLIVYAVALKSGRMYVTQKTIGDMLDLPAPNISTGFKRLRERLELDVEVPTGVPSKEVLQSGLKEVQSGTLTSISSELDLNKKTVKLAQKVSGAVDVKNLEEARVTAVAALVIASDKMGEGHGAKELAIAANIKPKKVYEVVGRLKKDENVKRVLRA